MRYTLLERHTCWHNALIRNSGSVELVIHL